MTTIERDFAIIFGQRIDRPESMVPGDWLSIWDRLENPVDYQEAFNDGAGSVDTKLAEEIKDLEDENEELRSEISDLENKVDSLELEIERLGEEIV